MARLKNAKWTQEDLDKWEDEIIELVYSNMLRRIRLVTVEGGRSMRLFDAGALDNYKFKSASERMDLSVDYMSGWNDAIDHIAIQTPTVEAVPVVHGRWVHDGYDIPHGVDWMHCSNCGKRDVYCPAALTNYCPNCGARMDEEREEE